MKRIAVVQSNYIPWKGYFDLIAAVEEFIIYDDMQFTRRDWRNRNRIKTPAGTQWLTVPVQVKGHYHQSIRETRIDNQSAWARDHWQAFIHNYRRATHFESVAALFEPLYLHHDYTHLSVLNRTFIETVCEYLGITTKISDSRDYQLLPGKTERLADLCLQSGANAYLSGPAARAYLDTEAFSRRGIDLQFFDYADYPPYPQLWNDFVHEVSIMDLLFNCGPDAPRYMKFSGHR